MKQGKTARGFDIIEFDDFYGTLCSLQKSSLWGEDAIWLGVNSASPKIMASQANSYGVVTDETTGWVDYPVPEEVLLTTRMHLTKEQVKDLLPILNKFAETGDIT